MKLIKILSGLAAVVFLLVNVKHAAEDGDWAAVAFDLFLLALIGLFAVLLVVKHA